ncbi:hypothetical protein DH09_00435 (plasmid) [Bacillaceae bacterium JMAK1]|nr:hypothetical protein DH09_00435 [Bacillaceae bacterium JMAK1]
MSKSVIVEANQSFVGKVKNWITGERSISVSTEKGLWIFMVVVLVLLLAVIAVWGLDTSFTQVMNDFLTGVEGGTVDADWNPGWGGPGN